MRRSILTLLFPMALAAACSSKDSGTVQVIITDPTTFTATPPVTTLIVSALDTSGDPATTLATATLPATAIDLGVQNENDVDAIEITGTDATGVERVFGRSLPVQYGQLVGATLPIFVQRVGELAALPGDPLSDSRQSPTVSMFEGQYLFVGGGSDPSLATTSQIYDFAQFAPLPQPPTLPSAPLSIAFVGTVGLFIDGSGSARYFDFSSGGSSDPLTPLAGGSFADVAGGATVIADDGTEFIVGATRTTTATSAVLEINPNDTSNSAYPYGNLKWLSLTENRLGAAATWVTGFGLVVTGGSMSASGVEVLALPQTTSATAAAVATLGKALPYPPDPSVGAGATTLTVNTVLLAGGISPALVDGGVRQIDLGCPSSCVPTQWEASLPVAIVSAQAFTLPSGGPPAFVVGNAPFSGTTHAYLLTTAAATEVKTKITHTNATAALSPLGSIVLVGGANDIESFVPSP
jgi:hypothetical protein